MLSTRRRTRARRFPEDLLPLLVSPEWVEERKLRWGVTSPIYQSKVLGEFPDISDDSLILPKWIEAAQKRTLDRTRRPIIAADIVRFGEDETVIMRREGGWIRVYRAHHKADTMVTAGHIAKATRDIDDKAGKNDWVRAVVDVPGVGGGVVNRLAELELPVVPYNGGEAPIDKERFVNARAEDYWTLRDRFEQGEIDTDPHDDKLAAQLGSIKWGIDSRGRIKIESKDDMRKRGLPSPDRADCAAIAFAGRANAAPINVVAGVACLLTIVSLREAGAGPDALVTGQTLAILYDRINLLSQSLMPAVNDLLLGYLLYKSRLVPRVLPVLAFIGAPLLLVSDAAVLFGVVERVSALPAIATLPVALFEFSLGVYLTVKGFRPSPITADMV